MFSCLWSWKQANMALWRRVYLYSGGVKAGGLFQVLQQSSRRAHENVETPNMSLLLGHVLAASNVARCECIVPRQHRPQHIKDLQGQLACWSNDQGAETISRAPLGAVQALHEWHQEGCGRGCG